MIIISAAIHTPGFGLDKQESLGSLARQALEARCKREIPTVETIHYPLQGTLRLLFIFPKGEMASLLVRP